MTHDKDMFAPSVRSYREFNTPAMIATLWIGAGGSVGAFITGVTVCSFVVAILVGLPFWTVAGYISYMTFTHEEKPLTDRERRLWRKYKTLDAETRSKVNLTVDDIDKAGYDDTQFDTLSRKVSKLVDAEAARKKEEARLDPSRIILLENLDNAIKEEYATAENIKKVMGDKPREIPQPPRPSTTSIKKWYERIR